MLIAYVDGNDSRAFVFCKAVAETKIDLQCLTIKSGKEAVVQLLNHPAVPDFIFIHCSISDVKCLSLMEFIKKHERLSSARVMVVNSHFSVHDKLRYSKAGASGLLCDEHRDSLISGLKSLMDSGAMH